MKNVTTIYCDGGSRGNPGDAASAFIVKSDEKTVFSSAKYLGKTTNNVAEYTAVLLALRWLKENADIVGNEIKFVLDSELVVKQLNGFYKVKNENLRNIYFSIKRVISEIGLKASFSNVSREQNRTADLLVNKELDAIS